MQSSSCSNVKYHKWHETVYGTRNRRRLEWLHEREVFIMDFLLPFRNISRPTPPVRQLLTIFFRSEELLAARWRRVADKICHQSIVRHRFPVSVSLIFSVEPVNMFFNDFHADRK